MCSDTVVSLHVLDHTTYGATVGTHASAYARQEEIADLLDNQH